MSSSHRNTNLKSQLWWNGRGPFRNRNSKRRSRGCSRLTVESLETRTLLTTLYELPSSPLESEILDDSYGWSVAMDGDFAVVGAPHDDTAGRDAGAAYVYQRDGDGWSEGTALEVKLEAGGTLAAGDLFGSSVAIDGTTIVVGARGSDDAVRDGGAVHIFTRSGDVWGWQAEISPDDLDRRAKFGERNALAVSGDTIVVGAPYQGTSGDAYVYDISQGTGSWLASSLGLPRNASFGDGVAVTGDTVVVGAQNGGAVYVFDGSPTSPAVLTRLDDGNLGWAVAISDDASTIVASSMWGTWVFERGGGDTWGSIPGGERLMPDSPDPGGIRFGSSLDISGDGETVVVGAPSDPTNRAYVFKKSDATWPGEYAQLVPEPDHALYNLGSAVATDGTIALVGARHDSQVLLFPTSGENSPPVAMDDSASTDVDTPVTIDVLANDSDANSDPLDVIAVMQGNHGSVVISEDNTVTYTPAPGFAGNDSFEYTISDGRGGQDMALVTVDVTPAVNDPPDAVDDSTSTEVDTPVTIDVLANDSDPDGDTLAVASVTDPVNGTVVINADNTVTYTPNADFYGADSFDCTISDGNGGTDTATVSIEVLADNANVLYVYDIHFESKRSGRDWRAVFEIRSDSNGDGQGGVTIEVEFAGRTYTGTTDSDGVFRTSWIKNLGSGEHYAEVADLVLTGYSWDPLALDLEDDSDGDGLPDDVLSRP